MPPFAPPDRARETAAKPPPRLLAPGIAAVGLALRLPTLADPLLEGAAGKQAHTAMVARNLFRGRATWLRPIVDDLGRPGYFVKELPAVPGLTALGYAAAGGVHEWIGRGVSAAAWIAAVPLVLSIARRSRRGLGAAFAALWFVVAPLGLVYSRAFMNDAAAVAVSIAALGAALRWRDDPTRWRAAAVGALVSASVLLKLHAIFWLAPALALVGFSRASEPGEAPPSAAARALLLTCAGLGLVIAAAWYAHAAAIHRQFPVPGATVAQGWINPSLWLRGELYQEIARQELWMVLTPLGAALVLAGALFSEPLSLAERALAAWWLGVLLQCVAFAPRLFDELSRGTEYYQLAAVPAASVFLARGVDAVAGAAARFGARAAGAVAALLAVGLGWSAAAAIAPALAAPPRYANLIRDCAEVRRLTQPTDEVLVIADRGGTVLYYCDRRGTTLLPARSARAEAVHAEEVAQRDDLQAALGAARYLYVPFPDLLDDAPELRAFVERAWHKVRGADESLALYERNDAS